VAGALENALSALNWRGFQRKRKRSRRPESLDADGILANDKCDLRVLVSPKPDEYSGYMTMGAGQDRSSAGGPFRSHCKCIPIIHRWAEGDAN